MALPELPRAWVDTAMPDMTGYVTKTVGAGKDFPTLQAALAHASVKDATTGIILSLTAGETFTSRAPLITLPVHTNPWIIIQASAASTACGCGPDPLTLAALAPRTSGSCAPRVVVAAERVLSDLESATQPNSSSTSSTTELKNHVRRPQGLRHPAEPVARVVHGVEQGNRRARSVVKFVRHHVDPVDSAPRLAELNDPIRAHVHRRKGQETQSLKIKRV